MTEKSDLKLRLPDITICAAASVNVRSTLRALRRSLDIAEFGASYFFTDEPDIVAPNGVEVIEIDRLHSSSAYSNFILRILPKYIQTEYCLISQWDGHAIASERWRGDFLDYDYIGASWPQFIDGNNVGNGGFSLRSKRLMDLCRDIRFVGSHPEDVAICRTNRSWLEAEGIRFAPEHVADQFSCERAGNMEAVFGYHGGFNIPRALGIDEFWAIYEELDDRSSLRPDFWQLTTALMRGHRPFTRVAQFACDRLFRW